MEGFYPNLLETSTEAFKEIAAISHSKLLEMVGEWATNKDSFKNVITQAINDLIKATENYGKELDKLQQIAGVDFSRIGEEIDKVSQKIDDMNGTTDRMVQDSSQYLDELRRVLEAVADS